MVKDKDNRMLWTEENTPKAMTRDEAESKRKQIKEQMRRIDQNVKEAENEKKDE